MPKLDRVQHFDPRSRAFSILELVAARRRSWTWGISQHLLDQGEEGACTAFGSSHELAARPVVIPVTNDFAFALYREIQAIDRTRHNLHFDEGATCLAAAKALQDRRYILGYRWAFGLDDLLAGVGFHGPAVIGITLTEGMMRADASGEIKDTGQDVGGHCMAVIGVDVRSDLLLLPQSWGEDYSSALWRGRRMPGYVTMSFETMNRRLKDGGEAFFPVHRRTPKALN